MRIKGHDWTIYLVTPKVFKKEHGRGCDAATNKVKREIWFHTGGVSLSAVRHELFHAFVAECRIDSAGLDADQMEEIAAEIVGEELHVIQRMASKILRWLEQNKNGRAT